MSWERSNQGGWSEVVSIRMLFAAVVMLFTMSEYPGVVVHWATASVVNAWALAGSLRPNHCMLGTFFSKW